MLRKKYDIVGLGVATLDILSIVDHFSSEEEVQRAIENVIDGGGPVATALVTASKLGAKTVLLDNVGDDWIGVDIREGLRNAGVDTSFINVKKGCSSSIAQVLVRKNDGARIIVYSPGSVQELTREDFSEEIVRVIKESKYLHINGRHYEACLQAIAIAKRFGTQVSFDGGAHRYNEKLRKIIPSVDLLIASKHFIYEYTEKNNNDDAAKELLELGIEAIVITDGKNGSWLYKKNIIGFHQPAFINSYVVDTTGCGDSYHGAFLYSLSCGYDLKESMRIASAVASINTQTLGGRRGLPSKEELQSFFKNIYSKEF